MYIGNSFSLRESFATSRNDGRFRSSRQVNGVRIPGHRVNRASSPELPAMKTRRATSPCSSEVPGDSDSGAGQLNEVSPGAPTSRRDLSQYSASVSSYPGGPPQRMSSSGLQPSTSKPLAAASPSGAPGTFFR
jgi:hypothetical protein